MKIFFNVKNPYYKEILPTIGDVIRLYNNTYILTSNIDKNIFEMKNMCTGEIRTYSLLRRPFEIIMTNACKEDICNISTKLIIKKDNIISNYLETIDNHDYITVDNKKTTETSNSYSYCCIM
jgi:hypothetical protein